MRFRAIYVMLLGAALTLALIPAPGGAGRMVRAQENGYLRVIHAAPGAPPVDIYLDGANEATITNLAFGAATEFIALPVKTYDVTLRTMGSAPDSAPLYDAKGIELPVDISLNLIVVGLIGGQEAQAFGLRAFVTDRGPTEGKARLEIIHASPDASAIDVLASGNLIAQNLAYGTSTAQPLNIEPNIYDLTVVPATLRDAIVFEVKGVELEADSIYTLVALGRLAEMRPLLLMTKPLAALAGGAPEPGTLPTFALRVVHASPDAPAVDVYLDGNAAIRDLKFGSASQFTDLTAQNYDIALRAAGSPPDSPPLFEVKSAALGVPGQSVDVVAVGLVTGSGDQSFRLRIYAIDRSPTDGKARLQVIHVSPDAPAIDVLAGESVLIANLAYPNGVDAPVTLDPNTYDIVVVPTGTKEPILIDLRGANITADIIYTVYAIGRLAEIKALVLTSSAPSPQAAPTAEATAEPTP